MKSLAFGGLLLAAAALLPTDASGQSVRPGDVKVFRFGQEQPTVVCAEMRICTLELQAGEDTQGQPLVADTSSWSVVVYHFGEGTTRRAEVAVKPLLCGVSTNMVVPTTRRRYELSLLSAPCRDVDDWDANASYTRRVRFAYPDDAEWRNAQEKATTAVTAARDSAAVPLAAGAGAENLRFDYSWRRTGGFPWEPLQVVDDGSHTYIYVPEEARQAEQAILYVVEDSGQRALLNYAGPRETGFYKTDRIVAHLALVIAGPGGRPKVLHIDNRRMGGR
ncbi:MAG: trbG [Gemmatimonadetes bacterium]|nr:trbG [Gemmatimonadota bacterium]